MDLTTQGTRIDLQLRTRPRSEVVAFGKLMAALETMRSKDPLVAFQVEIYEDRTADVPLPLLTRAVQRAVDTLSWRPVVSELLSLCETVRKDLRAKTPYRACDDCANGWKELQDGEVIRLARCGCWHAWQDRMASLGAGAEPLALPAGE